MKTFKDRITNPGYVRYLRLATCLIYIKEALEKFTKEVSKELASDIAASFIQPFSNHSYKPCSDAKFTVKYNRRQKIWKIDCCTTCMQYVDEIQKKRDTNFHFKEYNWKNADNSQWSQSDHHWEIAKTYMNQGQTKDQTGPENTDLSGILNFVKNCKKPRKWLTDGNLIEQVLVIRNKLMHTCDMTITEAEFDDYVDVMINFLKDLKKLWPDNDDIVLTAILEIKKTRSTHFHLSEWQEYQLVFERFAAVKGLVEDIQAKIRCLRDHQPRSGDFHLSDYEYLSEDAKENFQLIKQLDDIFTSLTAMLNDDESLGPAMKKNTEDVKGRIEKVSVEAITVGRNWIPYQEWEELKRKTERLNTVRDAQKYEAPRRAAQKYEAPRRAGDYQITRAVHNGIGQFGGRVGSVFGENGQRLGATLGEAAGTVAAAPWAVVETLGNIFR